MTACAGGQPAPPEQTGLLDGVTAEPVSMNRFDQAVSAARAVYIGEYHDRAADHALQRALLERVHERRGRVALGMEMFRVGDQDALDAYVAGDITEAELLEKTNWRTNWGFPSELYAPLWRYAREHRLPLIGLNAPRTLTASIAMGGIHSLSPDVRASLPELVLDDAAHRAYFAAAIGGAEGHGGMSFEDLYAAQVTWDETMAASVHRALKRSRVEVVVVVAGRGHVDYGYGIPRRAERRGVSPWVSVIPMQPGEPLDVGPPAVGTFGWRHEGAP